MWVLQCIMILFCVCFENDIHSTAQLFTEYCKLSVFICGVKTHLHIKVMCLRFYVKFESVLKENTLGCITDNGVFIFIYLFIS